jgi:hypothetical protein
MFMSKPQGGHQVMMELARVTKSGLSEKERMEAMRRVSQFKTRMSNVIAKMNRNPSLAAYMSQINAPLSSLKDQTDALCTIVHKTADAMNPDELSDILDGKEVKPLNGRFNAMPCIDPADLNFNHLFWNCQGRPRPEGFFGLCALYANPLLQDMITASSTNVADYRKVLDYFTIFRAGQQYQYALTLLLIVRMSQAEQFKTHVLDNSPERIHQYHPDQPIIQKATQDLLDWNNLNHLREVNDLPYNDHILTEYFLQKGNFEIFQDKLAEEIVALRVFVNTRNSRKNTVSKRQKMY